MGFFNTPSTDSKTGLPSPSAPINQTKARTTIDWQFTPHPVDGPIRQGKRPSRIKQDSNSAPILTVSDMAILIKENFAAYISALPTHPSRRYPGPCNIVTGSTTDKRKFARLEVRLVSDGFASMSNTSTDVKTHVLGVAIAQSTLKALNGLMKVSQMWFEQDVIRALPSVAVEQDDDDSYSITESDITLLESETKGESSRMGKRLTD